MHGLISKRVDSIDLCMPRLPSRGCFPLLHRSPMAAAAAAAAVAAILAMAARAEEVENTCVCVCVQRESTLLSG